MSLTTRQLFLNPMLSILLIITFVQQKELAPEATNLATMVKLTTLTSGLLQESLPQGRGRHSGRQQHVQDAKGPNQHLALCSKVCLFLEVAKQAVIYHPCF